MKRVLLIEDLSLLNQISATAALPILTAAGVRPATLPTAILSTQTEGFGRPVQLPLGNFMAASAAHWRTQRVSFAGLLVGYPGSLENLRRLPALLDQLPAPLRLVDPVLGDQGSYYPGLGPATRAAFLPVARLATILTPNWTELGLLAGQEWKNEPAEAAMVAAGERLRGQGITAPLVVTGVHRDGQVGCLVLTAGTARFTGGPGYQGHFTGAGDAFVSLLLAELVRGRPFLGAVHRAQDLLTRAIAATARLDPAERRDGLVLQPLLRELTREEITDEH